MGFLLVVTYCRDSSSCNVLLTLLLLLLLMCHSCARSSHYYNTFLQLLPEALVAVLVEPLLCEEQSLVL
jgi:hypothetical protein